MLQDLKSNIGVAVSLVPAVRTAGAANGLAVNLTGFLSAVVDFSFGILVVVPRLVKSKNLLMDLLTGRTLPRID